MSAGTPVALTIAGSDPSGGAGIQADLKTFHRFGVYGAAAITLLTVQNTTGVTRVHCLAPDLVEEQIRAVLEDIPPDAIKLGALGNAAIIEAVGAALEGCEAPIVIDPVMIGKHGAALMDPAAVQAFKRILIPRAFLITPNLPEAATLTGGEVTTPEQMKQAAKILVDLGARGALIKGGHLAGKEALDVLLFDGFHVYASERLQSTRTHGTGCACAAGDRGGFGSRRGRAAGGRRQRSDMSPKRSVPRRI